MQVVGVLFFVEATCPTVMCLLYLILIEQTRSRKQEQNESSYNNHCTLVLKHDHFAQILECYKKQLKRMGITKRKMTGDND